MSQANSPKIENELKNNKDFMDLNPKMMFEQKTPLFLHDVNMMLHTESHRSISNMPEAFNLGPF